MESDLAEGLRSALESYDENLEIIVQYALGHRLDAWRFCDAFESFLSTTGISLAFPALTSDRYNTSRKIKHAHSQTDAVVAHGILGVSNQTALDALFVLLLVAPAALTKQEVLTRHFVYDIVGASWRDPNATFSVTLIKDTRRRLRALGLRDSALEQRADYLFYAAFSCGQKPIILA